MSEEQGFLSRWARRKTQVRTGVEVPAGPSVGETPGKSTLPAGPIEPAAIGTAEVPVEAAPVVEPQAPAQEPPPTLEDVALLTRSSDYSRFVAPGVDGNVRNAAMKKLFSDPHFNVMDGLDIYIDDYGKPNPIPPAMLRLMRQSEFLGLFRDEEKSTEQEPPKVEASPDGATAPAEASSPSPSLPAERPGAGAPPPPRHEDTDLRLQPDDAAGRAGPDESTRD
ncbi:MAG: DUF3306 domain-containing protein [Rhizobacter sp.]|nr:DUF3306 domain-containing protein [Rhizobacter sp.]